MSNEAGARAPIFTIGHSTRQFEDFRQLLESNGVKQLVDVRSIPRSRRNPQYDSSTLPGELRRAGISYTWMPGLGGRRRPVADSPNTGWRNESFRGYADYMNTPEFRTDLDGLIAMSDSELTAIMCAEAVPWRCHRSLIADALLARGVDVREIAGVGRTVPHRLTRFAKIEGDRIVYPSDQGTLEIG